MTDNQNFLLRDQQASGADDRAAEPALATASSPQTDGILPARPGNEAPSKFGSRTYVSSRGYFFQ